MCYNDTDDKDRKVAFINFEKTRELVARTDFVTSGAWAKTGATSDKRNHEKEIC